jgi:hypothetical protein
MSVGDIYNVALEFSSAFADGVMVTTYDYRLDSLTVSLTEPEICTLIGDTIVAGWESAYLPLITDEIVFDGVRVFNRSQPTFFGISESGEPGTELTSESLPMRCAPVVSKRTGLRGRSYRGRNYWMAPPEIYQNQGVMTVAYRASLDSFAGSLLSILLSGAVGTITQVVYSEKLAIGTTVTSASVNDIVGSVRGRQKTTV